MEITQRDGHARRGHFATPHGAIETPAFMNVATAGAIKGAVSGYDLAQLRCQVQLCNTYHLHLRPGEEVVRRMGGLHSFTGFAGPILTDSGGFQVFSLAKLRRIREEGVTFASHIDGRRLFIGPEESVRIQSALASTIAMAFDECIPHPAGYDYIKASCDRTLRWLERCRDEMARLNALPDTLNPRQMLFGINQGGTRVDLRVAHMRAIAAMELDGYAIGGLAVGETTQEMNAVIEAVTPHMPADKPRYLMGVGTPGNILDAVARGVDLFDCVMPARNARHGHVFTKSGRRNLMNARYIADNAPLDERCGCPVCRRHTRGYIHHLFKAGEMLAMRLCVMHNLYFYNTLMQDIRDAIEGEKFDAFYAENRTPLEGRV